MAQTYRRVLVPTDFSDDSAIALREALGVARQFEAELLLVHVIEPTPQPTRTVLKSPLFEQMKRKLHEHAEKKLAELWKAEVGDGVAGRTMIADGPPSHEIVRIADEADVDLIVLSTHGRTGLKRLLLGSTTEKVVRLAGCSVLVVRAEGHRGPH